MSAVEFNGTVISDARGRLTPRGKIWVRLAYLATLNLMLGKDSFAWSLDSMATWAGCRKEDAADAAGSATEHGVVTRIKTTVGDRTVWRYTEGEHAWDLYVNAVREGVCDVIMDEEAGERAVALADRLLIGGVDKLVFAQLARRSVGQIAMVSVRELAAEIEEHRRALTGLDDTTVTKSTIHRSLQRLEARGVVSKGPSKGRRKTPIWVAVEQGEAPYEWDTKSQERDTNAD